MKSGVLLVVVLALAAGAFVWFGSERRLDEPSASLQPTNAEAREAAGTEALEALPRPDGTDRRTQGTATAARAAPAPEATPAPFDPPLDPLAKASKRDEKSEDGGLGTAASAQISLEDAFAAKYDGRSNLERSSSLSAIDQILADLGNGKAVSADSAQISLLKEEADWLRNHPDP